MRPLYIYTTIYFFDKSVYICLLLSTLKQTKSDFVYFKIIFLTITEFFIFLFFFIFYKASKHKKTDFEANLRSKPTKTSFEAYPHKTFLSNTSVYFLSTFYEKKVDFVYFCLLFQTLSTFCLLFVYFPDFVDSHNLLCKIKQTCNPDFSS